MPTFLRFAAWLLVLLAVTTGCKGKVFPIPVAATPAMKATPVVKTATANKPQVADERSESPPEPTAAETTSAKPEFPAAARERLVGLGVRVTDEAGGFVVDVRRNPKFGDDEVALICESPLVHNLTMEGVLITSAGIEQLQKLPKLERLILNDTLVGGQELETLAGQPSRATLVSLGLRATQVRDEDLRWLKEFTALERLDVSSTALTDACLAHLEDLPLLTINVSATQISADGVARLKKKNPQLVFRE